MKKLILFLLAAALLSSPVLAVETLTDGAITIEAPCAVLMERETGEVIYEKSAHERRSPASVTKVMTLLLIMEEIQNGSLAPGDMVTVSARAASMGGSQVWLEEGEQMSVGEMIKCIAVVSANDCCVAMAEHISGTEEAFVQRMNERAAELGCTNTSFTCCSGLLESDEHYSSAYDIALMSRALLACDGVRDYTTIWTDSVRGGQFALSNTNKLVRYYEGATGLKTGFTSKAMYCLSASAERGGTEFIAVVLGSKTSADRFESAKTLLNFAFSNYALYSPSGSVVIPPVRVELGGVTGLQPVLSGAGKILVEKSALGSLECRVILPESVKAPIAAGQKLGSLELASGGETVESIDIVAPENVEKLSIWEIYLRLIHSLVCSS